MSVILAGLPAGVSASPASFTLTPPSSPSQTVVITANAGVTPGPISLTVTANSGSISHTDTTQTSQADFALAASGSILLTAGSTTQVSVSVDAFNGFAGQVAATLSGLPNGVAASPSTLTLAPGAAQTIALSAASTLSAGSSTLTLQGTSGSLSHNLDLSLSLAAAPAPPPPDFSLQLNSTTLSLVPGGSGQTLSMTATALNGFSGQVNVVLSGMPTGVTASS